MTRSMSCARRFCIRPAGKEVGSRRVCVRVVDVFGFEAEVVKTV